VIIALNSTSLKIYLVTLCKLLMGLGPIQIELVRSKFIYGITRQ
jgi:hypothetical protein